MLVDNMGGLVIRIIVFYFAVMLSMRLMGKREIGKLSIFDLVISIMIAEVSAGSLLSVESDMDVGLTIIAILVILQILMSYITLKSITIRNLFEGEPTLIIANGKIRDDEMRRTRYSLSDLMTQLREKDIASIADVEFAILETTGKLSVFPKAEKRPVTPEDLGILVNRTGLPLPVIVDGAVMDGNLEKIGKTRKWLHDQLAQYGHGDFTEVFYCEIDNQGNLYFDLRD